ncbi:MAG: hypothetical protein ACK5G7_01225, partial [Erysipelotrichaceae bacterium]
MGIFTINSAELEVNPDYEPLSIIFNIPPEGVTNNKFGIRINNGIGNSGTSELTFNVPPGITIIQPLVWFPVDFNPDSVTLNSINLILGTGATGPIFFKEAD